MYVMCNVEIKRCVPIPIRRYASNFDINFIYFCPLQILMDHNDLVELAPYTFANLANLSMVNLTYNKLTKFPLNALTLDTSKTHSSAVTEMEPIKTNSEYRLMCCVHTQKNIRLIYTKYLRQSHCLTPRYVFLLK